MDTKPPWHVVPVALLLDALFLLGTISLALQVPSARSLSGLPDSATLDYDSVPAGEFEPLSSDFIARILGIPVPALARPLEDTAASPVLASIGLPSDGDVGAGRLPRTIVEHPFDNDDFKDAHPISTIPFTAKTDTHDAEREDGEPDACDPVGGTVWYRYRPTKNLGLLASTFGSDHAVAIGVFRGRGLSDLTLVDCNANTSGNAQVVFPAMKHRSYYFQVVAPLAGGKLVFSLDPLGTTSLVSVAHDDKKSGNRGSGSASVSAHGRYVAFASEATDLVRRKEKTTCLFGEPKNGQYPMRPTNCQDIFVRDRTTGRTELVSKNSRGPSSNGPSEAPAISGNGRYVAFYSVGDNLVRDDNNDAGDFFVHDRRSHTTERVSVSSEGEEGTNPWSSNPYCKTYDGSSSPELDAVSRESCALVRIGFVTTGVSISGNGRYVAFASSLHGLVEPEPPHCTDVTSQDYAAQTNHGPGIPIPADSGHYACRQVYIHDRKTGQTRLASVSSDGEPGEGDSAAPFISRNGKWVVFSSSAPRLVDNDANGHRDVFLHNLRTGTTELVSVSPFGVQGDAQSGGTNVRGHQSVSDDGRWVAFVSHASNLSPGAEQDVDKVFLRDMKTGQITLLTTGAAHCVISADGRYIVFTEATVASTTDEDEQDLLVYDRITHTVIRVSVAAFGEKADRLSHEPEISADGHFVVFESEATNLDGRYEKGNGFKDIFIHELPWTR